MIINFVQTEKGLYSANFNIVFDGHVVGTATLKGKLGYMEGVWLISYFNDIIEMKPNGSFLNLGFSKKYRPYQVNLNKNYTSEIYQTYIRIGSSKIAYHTMNLNANNYDLFTVALGDEGFKSSVYENDVQIMQIDKSAVIYNDLHNYEIACIDKKHIHIALIFCCYMYTLGCYEPGKKAIKSVSKTIANTKNEFLKSKYNPNFKNNIVND